MPFTVILSHFVTMDDGMDHNELGVDEFLNKPVSKAQVE